MNHDDAQTSESSGGEWPWLYHAELDRIVDADTLVFWIDMGFSCKVQKTLRLLGINAPERNTPEGKAARNYVVDWFERHGKQVRLQTKKDKADSFGRYLAYVWVGETSLNDDLVHAGHAVVYRP